MASRLSAVMLGGNTVPVEVESCANVSQLRLHIAETLGVEEASVLLLTNSRELCGTELLADLEEVGVISVVLRQPDPAIYVADGVNHRISRWRLGDTAGETVAGSDTADDAMERLSRPKGVYVDIDGSIIVADSGNNRVMKWRRGQSKAEVVAGGEASEPVGGPYGVFADRAGKVYVAEFMKHRVTCWTPGAERGLVIAGSASQDIEPEQRVRHPANIFVTEDGAVYIAEYGSDRVTKWPPGSSSGDVVAGGQGKGRGSHQLDAPWGIWVDSEGRLYVSETNNHRVTRWQPGCDRGEVVAGGRGAGHELSQLAGPTGICMDKDGNLYVAENHNHRVTRWVPGGDQGEVVAGGNALGQAANQLNHPTDVFVV